MSFGKQSWPTAGHLQVEQLVKASTSESRLCLQGKQIIKTDQRHDVIIRNTLSAVQMLPRTAALQEREKAAGTILNQSPGRLVLFLFLCGVGLMFLLATFADSSSSACGPLHTFCCASWELFLVPPHTQGTHSWLLGQSLRPPLSLEPWRAHWLATTWTTWSTRTEPARAQKDAQPMDFAVISSTPPEWSTGSALTPYVWSY
jgi:hypothetical protein